MRLADPDMPVDNARKWPQRGQRREKQRDLAIAL